jgi:malate dehydrogenase (oxaloacetate-decarboxylating)(NADP+)
MEGKGVLFKRFAGIDVFDLELDTKNVEEIINAVKILEPTFGGINLEDIKAPECFEIEQRLQDLMSIPVFHDDQHGTAIISAAGLINALEITGKKIDEVKLVVSGAGAAAFGCLWLYEELGLKRENAILVDTKGVIYKGRTEGMTDMKAQYAVDTDARTLADALVGADVLIGLSVGGIVTKDMLKTMADKPIVFAMANPDPEITYDDAKEARPDCIMATGRSDYPNQVNNVLGFPFIFRGALDCRATKINMAMKLAASKALAELAKEDVPDMVLQAYSLEALSFGPDYIIPKPFDYRVLLHVPVAVAKAAADTGVAQEPIQDYDEYRRQLETLLGRSRKIMHTVFDRAKRNKKRIVFPEGESEKIVRAAKILAEEGIAEPILLARPSQVQPILDHLDFPMEKLTVIDIESSPDMTRYAGRLSDLRCREGVTLTDAKKLLKVRNYWAMMMVDQGDADGVISGLNAAYPETIKPALQVLGTRRDVKRVSGAYILMFKDREVVLADTTVNIDPSAEDLAEIAILTAETARRFGIEPKVAMLSFSNFGSTRHPQQEKVRRAVEILRERAPDLVVDGEMQADTAVAPSIAESDYPWSAIKGDATVLVFPDLDSANISYKLLWRLGNAEAIGPILQGMARPVHVLQRGVDVNDIVSMAAVAVIDAQGS